MAKFPDIQVAGWRRTMRSVIALLVVVATASGCNFRLSLSGNSYQADSGDVPGYRYYGMWQVDKDSRELVSIVFVPRGISHGIATSYSPGNPPGIGSDISMSPDTLYLRRTPIPIGPGRRVFVFTKHRQLHPILLSEDELSDLATPAAMNYLSDTEAWGKIKEVLDREEWCIGCPSPPEPVEAARPTLQ